MARAVFAPRGGLHASLAAQAAPVALGPSLWTVFSWIGVALLLGTGAFSLYLIQVSSVATAGYEGQRLEAERQGWLARNEQLELELAKRRSLAWVEDQAVHRLGMVRVDRPTYVTVVAPWPPAVAAGSPSATTIPPSSGGESDPVEPENHGPLLTGISQLRRAAGGLESIRRWLAGAVPPAR